MEDLPDLSDFPDLAITDFVLFGEPGDLEFYTSFVSLLVFFSPVLFAVRFVEAILYPR